MADHATSHGAHAHGHEDDGRVHAHISSVEFYVGILACLIALTILTIGLSYVHLGKLNLIVAVVIATIKASLVVLFFMHLRHDNKFNSMILLVSLLFIGVFFAYTLNDTDRRAELDVDQGGRISPETGFAPGGMGPATTISASQHGASGGDHGGASHGATPSGGHAAPPAPAGETHH